MEINLNITMADINQAEIVFLRNTCVRSDLTNNFSYIVWYDIKKDRVIVGKSRMKTAITNIEYFSSYNGIREYIERDLNISREHLQFKDDGLFRLVEKFIVQFGNEELLDMLIKENETFYIPTIEKKEEEDKLIKKEQITYEKEEEDYKLILEKDKILMETRKKIKEMIETKADACYSEHEIKILQDKIESKRLLNYKDIKVLAIFFVKAFGVKNISDDEIDDIIKKMIPKYFYNI